MSGHPSWCVIEVAHNPEDCRTESGGVVVGYINIQPSWSAILPVLLGVLQNPDAPVKAHNEAMANLEGMANLADKFVELVERGSGDTTGLTPQLTDPDAPEVPLS